MKKLLALLALLLALPASAANVARTSSAAFYWNGVATGSWTGGGTPDVADSFTIAHHVVLQANPALTTGSITIASGGTLVIPPGITLQYGDGSSTGGNPATVGLDIQTGGTLIQQGALIRTCRITTQPDWSAGVSGTHTVTVTTDCDLTNVSTSTDYVFFGDEDPADLDAVLTGKCVHAGPGVAPPGCHRPAYNKWASYDITAASGHSLTYDLEPRIADYTATPNGPYAGNRFISSATPIDVSADLTYAVRWLGRRTAVTIGAGTYQTAAALIAGDLGSRYLAFDEVASIADDPTACSGLAAKVLHSTTGASDTLEVEGDVSGCTHASATAQITPGARRGDVIHIYRPATLLGSNDGDAVGEGGIANSGGHWYARWARISQPFGIATATFTPNTTRAGAIQFLQGSATAQPTADWDWVDIAYPGFTAGSDVGVLHFDSADSTGTNIRFPNNGLLDMTGSTFRHVHIHDSINNAVNGGGHGIYVDAAKGVDIAQFRIERINDDCLGGDMVLSDGTVVENNSVKIRHLLNYECIAETNNSQQGIEFQADATEGTVANNPGIWTDLTFQDVLSIGHDLQPLVLQHYRAVLKGITTGGISRSNASTNVFVRIDGSASPQTLLSDATVGAQAAYANRVEDSNLYTFGPTSVAAQTQIAGWVRGSFIAGNDQVGTAGAHVGHTSLFERSVIDLAAGAHSGGYFINGSATSPFYNLGASFSDTVFRSTSESTVRLAQGLAPATGGFSHLIRRTALLMGAPDTGTNGVLRNFATGATVVNATTTIDGLFVSESGGTTTAATIAQDGSGVTVDVQAACMESTGTITTLYAGAAANGTTKIAVPTHLVPQASDPVHLRDLLGKAGGSGCHDRNLPLRLGYENFRVGHAMLGDFEILQAERSSSDDLIRISPPFAHPRGQRD